MAGTNTEKPTGKDEKKKMATPTKEVKPKAQKTPVKEQTKDKKEETKTAEKKKPEVKKVKKDSTKVYSSAIASSTKVAASICRFIKYKPIKTAIADLEDVTKLKKAVPMKGEIPHRKGKIMSGRFPKKASEEFLVLLKSLQSNAIQFDLEEPIITEAIANIAQRPFAKGGRARKKRSNVTITATSKKSIKQKKKKE